MGFDDKDVLVRYLLGDLSRSECERLEKQLSASDRAREALTEAENDLIDSYACGDLSADQRRRFEENFLTSPERNDQLAVAQMLMDTAVREQIATAPFREQKERVSWWESMAAFLSRKHLALGLALVTAALAVAATGLLAVENWRLRNELKTAHEEQTELQRQVSSLEQQANNLTAASDQNAHKQDQSQMARLEAAPLAEASILLFPHLSRQQGSSNPSNRLVIKPGMPLVTIRLDLERDAYPRYDVAVETVEGAPIRRAERLTSQAAPNGGRCVAVELPSRLLGRGDYVLTLYGRVADNEFSIVDSYTLSVAR